MSIQYRIVEKCCCFLNDYCNGAVKNRMYRLFSAPQKKEQFSREHKRKFRVRELEYRGFSIYLEQLKNKKKRTHQAVLFLAGGGGMARPTGLHYGTAGQLLKQTGATLYFPFYPLAPEHNVQEALDWLERVYGVIRKRHASKDITIIGDSAGANLALSLAGRLREKPGKIILISPAAGLDFEEGQKARKSMEKADPILSVEMNDLIAEHWAKNVDLHGADISPEYVDYKEFSKIQMFYGTHELFYPCVKKLIAIMKEQKAPLELHEEPMCHDWALCGFFPEGKRAVRAMAEFIKKPVRD